LKHIVAPFLIAAIVAGCASTPGRDEGPYEAADLEVFQTRLREQVEAEIRRLNRNEGPESVSIQYDKPFYYKVYEEYPGAEDVYTLQFTETESRTTPLTAEFEIEKIRFATDLRKKRTEAQADDEFFRSRGVEQTSYELRNGRWRETGSIFIATRTEQRVDGEWEQVEILPRPVFEVEEERGGLFSFFRRRR